MLAEGVVHGKLHLGADNMFAEGRNEVFDSAGDPNAVRSFGHKLHRVANAVAPKAGVGVQNQRVVDPQFDLANAQARRVLFKELVGGHKFVEHFIVQEQQQIGAVRLVLVGKKAFGGGIGFQNGNVLAEELEQARAVRLQGHPARDKEVKIGEDLRNGLLARLFHQSLKVHLHPGRNAADDGHVGSVGFLRDGLDLGLPIFDAVGFPGGHAVFQ